jgi:hypothetical protein
MDSVIITPSGIKNTIHLDKNEQHKAKELIRPEFKTLDFNPKKYKWLFRLYKIFHQENFEDIDFNIFEIFTNIMDYYKDQQGKHNGLSLDNVSEGLEEDFSTDSETNKDQNIEKISKTGPLDLLSEIQKKIKFEINDLRFQKQMTYISEELLGENLLGNQVSNIKKKRIIFGKAKDEEVSDFYNSSKFVYQTRINLRWVSKEYTFTVVK